MTLAKLPMTNQHWIDPAFWVEMGKLGTIGMIFYRTSGLSIASEFEILGLLCKCEARESPDVHVREGNVPR